MYGVVIIVEFNEKLQELRKQKGFTQEELAEALYVSRTAVSKWESGRGYPGIDSLKAVAAFFRVTVDELLSGGEILTVAEQETKEKEKRFRDMVFGLLDCCACLFFFLPLFGQNVDGNIRAVSLLYVSQIAPYLKAVYVICVSIMAVFGVLTLALQNVENVAWNKINWRISLFLSVALSFVFIVSSQPYCAAFTFVLLVIKGFMMMKKQ